MPVGAKRLRPQTLPKAARLRRRSEFLQVQRGGRRVRGANLILLTQENGRSLARLGITISRKVGGAVLRNQVKRHLRVVFRHLRHGLPSDSDFLFIAREGAAQRSGAELATEATALLAEASRLNTHDLADRGRRP